MKIISANNIGKTFLLRQDRKLIINDMARFVFKSKTKNTEFYALNNISFDVERGEIFGIIGENGSGKSTLLKIIAGITKQTEGTLEIHGSVAALLELGAGFHPFLTGRENIYLNGSILGLKRREIKKIFDEIVDFAEIRDFIDIPVKNYSSGMFVRLGFAIAVHLDPDILIIDEVLSVGDESFQRKCFQKINEFKKKGKTIIFVTHDMNAVSSICDRVMLLKKGEILKMGKVGSVVELYLRSVGERKGVGIIKKGDLTLIFNNGRLSIFYKDTEITRTFGGYSAIYAKGSWHETVKALWEITILKDDYIKCTGNFRSLPMKQVWEIKLNSDRVFELKISLEVIEKIDIEEFHFSFLMQDSYTEWFTQIETGIFPDITDLDREWIHLNLRNYPSEFCGLNEVEKDDKNLPCMVVDYCSADKKYIATILDTDCGLRSRVIQWLKILTKAEKIFEPGIYDDYFHCTSSIISKEEFSIKYKNLMILQDRIENDHISTYFNNGKIDSSYTENFLTASNSIFISVLSENIWHESTQSISSCEKIDESTIKAVGKFRRLSLSYLIDVKVFDENTIVINFKIQKHEKQPIQKISLNFIPDTIFKTCSIYTENQTKPEHEITLKPGSVIHPLTLSKDAKFNFKSDSNSHFQKHELQLSTTLNAKTYKLEFVEEGLKEQYHILKLIIDVQEISLSGEEFIDIGSMSQRFILK
jgi:ABC-type polysaccharide/polyol phosphate transport system ATPase subunit